MNTAVTANPGQRGSHGGGTSEGQRGLLAELGVTENRMGCPVRCEMETVILGSNRFGLPIVFDRNAFENVALPLRVAGLTRDEIGRRVRAALDKVGLLKYEKALPITLSGGEQQRLCIARAIVHRPAILLADEPTGNLDAAYATEIGDLFRSFNQVGVTVIVATHDQALLARLTPRVIALRNGALAEAA